MSIDNEEASTVQWLRSLRYILIALTTWVLTSYAYYHLLALLRPSRQMTFFVSMGLVLLVMLCGLYFEDRLIWKGYFDGPYKRDDVVAGGRRTAPPPPGTRKMPHGRPQRRSGRINGEHQR